MARLLTAIVCSVVLYSCDSIRGSGNIITETRKINQFNGVKSSGSIDVEVMNDQTQLVKIEADDNVMSYIITKVEDGMLNVYLKHNMSYTDINVKVYVRAPVLTRLAVSGSGSLISNETLTADNHIDLKVSGSGNIDVHADAPSITAGVSGSGTMILGGRTKDLECSVSGSGDLKGRDLLSENTVVHVSGSGSANVFASVSINAKVSGSGDVVYSGNPSNPVIHKSGSGSVREFK